MFIYTLSVLLLILLNRLKQINIFFMHIDLKIHIYFNIYLSLNILIIFYQIIIK